MQEVGNKWGERYPLERLYNIIRGLERFLVKKNGEGALSPLAVSDKRYRERVICSLHFNFLLLELHSLKEIEFCLLEMSFISN